jgi:cellulose synthase (UDP-forming)
MALRLVSERSRDWSERSSCPRIHRGSARRELVLSMMFLALTCVALLFLVTDLVRSVADSAWSLRTISAVTFAVTVLFLIYGNLTYQVCRIGSLRHHKRHRAVSERELDQWAAQGPPPRLTVLVPSYREELRTVEQTLMSAALQQFPGLSVVLLLDDPPSTERDACARRTATLDLVKDLNCALAAQAQPIRQSLQALDAYLSCRNDARHADDDESRRHVARRLTVLAASAGSWLEERAARWSDGDHTDRFFGNCVLAAASDRIRRGVSDNASWEELVTHHKLILAIFDCELSVFERKKYENLSHEPNKAMNLNSYIALLGSRWKEIYRDGKLFLVPSFDNEADLEPPGVEYILTLDADSILLPQYALRLVHTLEEPGNERIAVMQTPYRAIPGSKSELERIAGATTDMQHIIHQGFTQHGATFWVGANSLLRARALHDIATTSCERGYEVVRYISDRTVIEDTESSIDLVHAGWRLWNYPATLAFSATPADFGALVIQRRRWANGGLIILAKLLRLVGSRRPLGVAEAFLRTHYLVSIAATNVALLLLLCYGFPGVPVSVWLPLTAIGYFVLYARDLSLIGYRASDILRVYALNVLLLPVNLAGVITSVRQGITGAKIPFGRTPKVDGRTTIPRVYLALPLALIAAWTAASIQLLITRYPMRSVFVAVNAVFMAYAVLRFIGWTALQGDLFTRPSDNLTPLQATPSNERAQGVDPERR